MAPPEQIDLEVGIPLPYVNPSSGVLMHDVGQLFEEYHLRLQKACLRGDWKAAEKIHENHPNCFQEKISRNGDTALHIAAAAGRDVFVKQLLTHAHLHGQKLDLELPNNEGNTALYLAAASGKVNIVHQMRRLKPNLLNIPGGSGMKPIQIAVLQGHDKMVEHLLDHCFHDLSRNEQTDLLIATLEKDIYDVAWKIIQKDKDDEIATRRNGNSLTPLHVLARKTHIESRSYLKYDWIPLRKQHQDHLKNELVENLWRRVISSRNHQKISELLSFPQPELLFVAIRMGNYEFVTTLIRHYPDLIWEKDHQRRTIFHAAVEYRQEKIFSHIFQLEGIRHLLTAYTNPFNRNNILHLAATLPEPEILGKASGAALQMQRELLWFQAVESIVPRQYAHSENSTLTQISDTEVMESTETPREMFNREHEQLRKDGENWMRKTSASCMVVAALVATIVFQAIFQPPNKQSNEKLFWVFVISDAFSLLSSTASILTFLSILTSTYAEEDFLVSSLKLMVGLVLLLFSILAILLVFTVSIIILLPYKSVWIIVAVFAWFTGVIYLRLHFPLLVVVYRSTFGTKYLFRHQHELFRD
ncbi:ankyrin repeat-containing protein ITN1-like [Chenopodium quinoa]|uniref:PGG domain-containing protein n=1 Tax=Chenopodium quinoa TaxID=63459 RepID=A0A803L2A7_CHEQI|nr:ankyrin repeat-containing protein ITN1-like [Chenopodium quinoa]